jgi:hypothetical protein
MSRHHHSPDKSTRRAHVSLGLVIIPNVSHVWRKRRRPESDILKGELRKIKPSTFNVSTGKEKRSRPGYWK